MRIQARIKRLQSYLKQFPYQHQRYRIGAMILDKRGRVKSIASNSYTKTHPIMTSRLYDCKSYLHAEIASILSASISKTDSILVIRIDSNGELRPSKPCDGCMKYITEYTKLDSVIYLNEEGDIVWHTISRSAT